MSDNDDDTKAMHALFAPAITLLNRYSYTRKFTLLWLVSLLAIAVVVYSLFVNLGRVIQPLQQRIEGTELIEPLARTLQSLQLHRGLSAALLGGNASLRDRRAEQAAEVTASFAKLEENLPRSLADDEAYLHLRTEWARVQKEGLSWSVSDNLRRHTHLIEHVHHFEQQIADEYLLADGTDVAAFYLTDIAANRLVHVLEHLGRLRAYGTGVLSQKQLTEEQRIELRVMMAELDDALRHFNLGIASAGRHNSAIHGALLAIAQDVDDSSRAITNIVETDILSGRFATAPETFLDAATVQIERSYTQMYDSLLPMAKRLAQAQIEHAKWEMSVSIGISLAIFLLAVYLSVSIYYSIIGHIRTIARSASALAQGDLNQRIWLGTRDELSQVGESFNEMAEGFKRLLEMHREDEERLRAAFETAMDAVVQMNDHGIITGWNHQAEKMFGWTREEALGRVLADTVIPPQYREAHLRGLEHFLFSGEGAMLNSRVELLGLHRDGREFPVELSITAVNMAGRYEFNGFIRDITHQKESEELIWKQANFDTLTGLPNRQMFHDRLAQDIKKSHRAGLKTALLFIDLDRFKEVNDTLGHDMGDLLLKEAAQRIGDCVRETDTVARLGGDEFTVILPELDDTASVDRIAGNILEELNRPFRLKNELSYISASIGITLHPVDTADLTDLLKNADQAMYAAKNAGRNRFSYFTQSMQQAAQARLRLTNDLRGALTAGQFRVHYQPIMELATGRIDKAEALLRWQHPERGMVSPAEFIPLAEESGLIVKIGDWVFREAIQQVMRMRALYNPDFQISVNVSPVQFCNAGGCVCEAWFHYLQELGLPGQCTAIEITEGLLLDADSVVAGKLLEFRDAGIQMAIDDFGTGYSSLSYLKKFDIDYLKIDQSFVRDLVTDPNDMALSEAIIVMAHRLGLKVIAEGVETEAQRALLSAAGCDYAQGYLFSRPLPADEFEELLKRQRLEYHHFQI